MHLWEGLTCYVTCCNSLLWVRSKIDAKIHTGSKMRNFEQKIFMLQWNLKFGSDYWQKFINSALKSDRFRQMGYHSVVKSISTFTVQHKHRRKYCVMGGIRTNCNGVKKPTSPTVQGKKICLQINLRCRKVRIRNSLLYIWFEQLYLAEVIMFHMIFSVQ